MHKMETINEILTPKYMEEAHSIRLCSVKNMQGKSTKCQGFSKRRRRWISYALSAIIWRRAHLSATYTWVRLPVCNLVLPSMMRRHRVGCFPDSCSSLRIVYRASGSALPTLEYFRQLSPTKNERFLLDYYPRREIRSQDLLPSRTDMESSSTGRAIRSRVLSLWVSVVSSLQGMRSNIASLQFKPYIEIVK